MNPLSLTREELYKKIWTKPLVHIAPEFGLSDRGLGKLCSRMEIPLPGRGYWRKVELGQPVLQKVLLPPSPSCKLEVSLPYKSRQKVTELVEQSDLVTEAKRLESMQQNKHQEPEATILEPRVYKTLAGFGHTLPDRYGLFKPVGPHMLSVCCSQEVAPRAARFYQLLLNILKSRGFQLVIANGKTYIEGHGEHVAISVRERVYQIPHEVTKEEKRVFKRQSGTYLPRYDYVRTGQLQLSLEYRSLAGLPRQWRDKKEQPLEQQLNAVMLGLAKVTAYLQARRAEEKREAQKQETKRRRLESFRLKQLAQQKQKAELEGLFERWFASPSKQTLLKASLKKIENGTSKEEWISWIQDVLIQDNIAHLPRKESSCFSLKKLYY